MKKILVFLAATAVMSLLTAILMFIAGNELPNFQLMGVTWVILNVFAICKKWHLRFWDDFILNKPS